MLYQLDRKKGASNAGYEFLNGLIADKGKEVGVSTPANAALAHIVKRVEKGDLQPDSAISSSCV